MEIFYQNSNGKRLNLDRKPYQMVKQPSFLDYEWDCSVESNTGRAKISGRKSGKRKISIVISADTIEECMQKVSEISDFFDLDNILNTSGRLYMGSGYLKCFIVKSQKSDKYVKSRKMVVDYEILPDGEEWIYEQSNAFRIQEASGTENNLDFNFDFPFDFYNGMSNMALLNESITDVDFEMVVYGGCENPEIIIGGQKYKVNAQLEYGEYLVINSLGKKIYKVKNGGEKVNQYHLKDPDWYIFQKIPPGSNSVSWNGLFGFDITLFERRSEPKWT